MLIVYCQGSLTRDEMTSMFLMMYQDPDQSKAEQKIAVKEITSKAEEMFGKKGSWYLLARDMDNQGQLVAFSHFRSAPPTNYLS